MKLQDLKEMSDRQYGFLKPARGPEDMSGVELMVVVPKPGEKGPMNPGYSYRSGGWWKSADDYYNGTRGFEGTRSDVESKFPNLEILNSEEEAISAATGR